MKKFFSIKMALWLAVGFVLMASHASLARAGEPYDAKGSYAVVVSRETYAMPEWNEVVRILREKHDGALILYYGDVRDARESLSGIMPRYACFVARPEESSRDFVVNVHRMTRRLDEDPYTDVVWGILTGYDADDAKRIAGRTEPLILRRGLGGCSSLDLSAFEEGIKFSEGQAGGRWIKPLNGEEREENFPADSTRGLVDAFNDFKPDAFMTSGHATTKNWQIGYNYRDGYFICKQGQLMGRDTEKKTHPINSPNSKVFLPAGNCLIGHIPERDCMALALMHTAGVDQMFGYTAVTFHGYMGWGIMDLLVGQRDHYTLSEAFYFNNQALLYKLETRLPHIARIDFESFEHRDVRRMFEKHGLKSQEELGSLWDRDVVAFYGDPAWEVRFPPCERAWNWTLEEKDGVFTVVVKTGKDGKWGSRPVMVFFKDRLSEFVILQGEELMPLLCDNFILLPLSGDFKAGQEVKVVFTAKRAPHKMTSKSSPALVAEPPREEDGDDSDVALIRILENLKISGEYTDAISAAIDRAGENAGEIIDAIEKSDGAAREAVCFLVANMPDVDLRFLQAKYILENVRWALEARDAVSWGKDVPAEIFLNDVLPYAIINEHRDSWRKDFFTQLLPLVKACGSPGEAAQKLNAEIFKLFNVNYHATKRRRPDQSPFESIEIGYASCTGLSVLLVDACRAVCVPARLAGTPQWTTKRGNHTWVEVWDKGWHFTGAAEYDPKGLNRGWFVQDASKADPDHPMHRIYATSFRKTGLSFPMVWNLKLKYVNALDVTARYLSLAGKKNVRIQLFDVQDGKRVAAEVIVRMGGEIAGKGRTRDETNDTNDMLEFRLLPGKTYEVEVLTTGGGSLKKSFKVEGQKEQTVTLYLSEG